ncbi:MAG: hypothetical protein NVSMB23_13930 [Myxococcales bacterium]
MSLSGNLEDVSVADALQFIHLGGRTGTLSLFADGRTAEIGFHQGRIVNAWGPQSKRLGDLLVDAGSIDAATLAGALKLQESETPRRSLGQILVSINAIAADAMYRAVEQQIERTVYDLVTWTQGTFQFALDDLKPIDDIAVFPGDIVRHLNLDTQMVLLDALRIFDERNRDAAAGDPAPAKEEPKPPPATEAQAEVLTERILVAPVHPEGADEPPSEPDFAAILDEVSALSSSEGAPGRGSQGKGPGDSPGVAGPRLPAALAAARDSGAALAAAALDAEPGTRPRLQVVTQDRVLAEKLVQLLAEEVNVSRQTLREAGTPPPGEPPPMVLIDLRGGGVAIEAIEALTRARPRAALLAVIDPGVPLARAFDAGVISAVPAELSVILAAYRSILRQRGDQAAGSARSEKVNANFAKLRRIVGDLRSGLISTTISLSLMNIISESVERAVLFLVRRDAMVALGAFGSNAAGAPLAQLTRGLHLPLEGRSALTAGLADGQVRSIRFDEARFPPAFADLVGAPRTGQCAIFPVLGGQRVVAMVYADNGPSSRQIEEIDILELAAAQAGLAFENELLRRQAGPPPT